MTDATGRIWIGTSGFHYPEWIGPLYAPRTRPGEMLPLYAREFPVVELNFTFYQMPQAGTLGGMARRSPEGFRFLVKMIADVTHALELDATAPFLDALVPLRDSGKLGGVLCQFPERFHRSVAAEQFLEALSGRLAGNTAFVEFRQRSWNAPEALHGVADLGFGVVSVDVPAIPSLFPRKLVRTGDSIYVRLHSRNRANWYADGKDRYDYLYTAGELTEWLDAVEPELGEVRQVYVLFNNCRRAYAVQNGMELKRLVVERFGPAALVPPVPSARPLTQARLFGS